MPLGSIHPVNVTMYNDEMASMSTLSKWQKWKSLWMRWKKCFLFENLNKLVFFSGNEAILAPTHLFKELSHAMGQFEAKNKREINFGSFTHDFLRLPFYLSDTIVRMQLNLRWCLVFHQPRGQHSCLKFFFFFLHFIYTKHTGREAVSNRLFGSSFWS